MEFKSTEIKEIKKCIKMKIRLHIKGSELKHLHNNPKKQFHIVTFTARLEPEDYIELLKTDGIIQVEYTSS